ncbi:MAG: Na+:solute symporter [Cytophagales bacterium]|nr:Na+:solute symporter [Cytophagales bacterium]
MVLGSIDWIIVGIFFVIVLSIGWIASRTAGKSSSEFFLGGRGMPWWLLGISMVACTFSADTPNLVTGMVRENGVAKNWAWWAFLITGMVTVFVYAKLWRRSGVMTDLEYYEKRYSGKAASFLRGFRSLYLGIFFNCLIMGTVTLAAIKIGGVMLGLEPWVIVVGASIVVVIYSALGGIKGVIWADFFQYGIAMFGAIYAAVVALRQPEVGGLGNLLSELSTTDKLSFIPDFSEPSVYIPLLIIPVAVQWWAVWYPGAEPGGGGYIAQRMLAAKNEKNAIGATLLFNFMHYAIRPWPWIIVALASILIYPDLASIKAEFPNIADEYLKDDIAYPVMLSKLSPGWLGLVVASIIAAYMSTIGTHLNWGSSYVVNDFYKRFVKPDASEKQMVAMGRITTVVLMIFAGILSLTLLDNATQAFNILLLSGAGSGAIYILRWFWWRINAWTEIVAMIVATFVGIILVLVVEDASLANSVLDGFTMKLLIAITCTTIAWITTMFLTGPETQETLRAFYRLTRPGGPGWAKVIREAEADGDMINEENEGKPWEMPIQILLVFIGCIVIYSSLFSIGSFLYGKILTGVILLICAIIGTVFLFKSFGKLRAN